MNPCTVELTPLLLDRLLEDPAPEGLRQEAGRAIFRERALSQIGQLPIPTAWALLAGDTPLAAFGTLLHWVGRAEGWMVLARLADRRARVAAARAASAKMDELQRHAAYRRIEMWVLDGEPWAPSFSRALRMRCEAVVEAFDPLGRDHLLYARIARPAEGTRA